MELVRFSNQLAGKDPTQPPYRLSARDLDSNFAKLKPLPTDGNARQYAINETPDGWFLTLFPDAQSSGVLPVAPASGTYVLGSINGAIQWLATESCS